MKFFDDKISCGAIAFEKFGRATLTWLSENINEVICFRKTLFASSSCFEQRRSKLKKAIKVFSIDMGDRKFFILLDLSFRNNKHTAL